MLGRGEKVHVQTLEEKSPHLSPQEENWILSREASCPAFVRYYVMMVMSEVLCVCVRVCVYIHVSGLGHCYNSSPRNLYFIYGLVL